MQQFKLAVCIPFKKYGVWKRPKLGKVLSWISHDLWRRIPSIAAHCYTVSSYYSQNIHSTSFDIPNQFKAPFHQSMLIYEYCFYLGFIYSIVLFQLRIPSPRVPHCLRISSVFRWWLSSISGQPRKYSNWFDKCEECIFLNCVRIKEFVEFSRKRDKAIVSVFTGHCQLRKHLPRIGFSNENEYLLTLKYKEKVKGMLTTT